MRLRTAGLLLTILFPLTWALGAIKEPVKNGEGYRRYCASGLGAERTGAPALLPGNLKRLTRDRTRQVMAEGRAAGPSAGHILSDLHEPPRAEWDAQVIGQTRIIHYAVGELADKPVHSADPLNLFLVEEVGAGHVVILDGDRLRRVARVPVGFELHGSPRFSPDGRYAYLFSHEGRIVKLDLHHFKIVAEIRAGLATSSLAVSGDGGYVAVGNEQPPSVVILDARDLTPVRAIDVLGREGKRSRVSVILNDSARKSFIVGLKDIAEVWEITYDKHAEPVYEGFVHDYQHSEGLPVQGPFPPRRIPLPEAMEEFTFHPNFMEIIGASQNGAGQVVNLDVRKRIATVDLPPMPRFARGITWRHDNRLLMAAPNQQHDVLTIIDVTDWRTIKSIETLGPARSLRTHASAPYAWLGDFKNSRKDTFQLIDKATMEVVKVLTPQSGKRAGAVEFSRDGRYALVSLCEPEGAVVVYDATSLKEVKRVSLPNPCGIDNVQNGRMRP